MSSPLSQLNPARIKSYVNRLPIFTRAVTVIIVALWVLSLQSIWSVSLWGALIPSKFGLAGLYRLNTFPLVHNGIFHMAVDLLALIPFLERFESENGSFFSLAMFYGIFSTLPAIFYMIFESLIWRGDTPVFGSSIWVFELFAMEAVRSSRSNYFFNVGPYKIPTWSTPIIMALLVSLLVPGTSFLGHLCGLATGYLYGFGYLSLLAPSDRILRFVEGKITDFVTIPHYVSVDQKQYGRHGVLPSSADGLEDGITMGFSSTGHRLG